jgi:hypothetical protein
MDSMLTSSEVKRIKLVFPAPPLSTQKKEVRGKTGWFGIRIMCPNGPTCLPAEYCLNGLSL